MQIDLRRATWKHVEDIFTPQESDSSPHGSMKRFLTFIKHKKADHNNVSPLRADGKLVEEAKEKDTVLNQQFQSVFTRPHLMKIRLPPEHLL